MRITGHGSGWGSGPKGGRERADVFRRRHRPGERVTGRVLRRDGPGEAWVDFEGVELLASIQSDPAPGSVLLFTILRLEPDILLQELHVARAAGDPLVPAADAFWTARARFESLSWDARAAAGEKDEPEARERALRSALAEAPDAAEALERTERAAAEVSLLLAARGGPVLGYRPWLLPETLSGEMLTLTNPSSRLSETRFSFTLPGQGQCELRLMSGPDAAGARLYLEHPQLAPAFEKLLVLRGLATSDQAFFKAAPLPPSARAGVLAPLLGAGQPGRPRFARRV